METKRSNVATRRAAASTISLIGEFVKQDMTIAAASKHLKLTDIGARRYFTILINDKIICWKKYLATTCRGLGPGLYTLKATPEELVPYLEALTLACVVPPARPKARQAKVKVEEPDEESGPRVARRDPFTAALFGPPTIRK